MQVINALEIDRQKVSRVCTLCTVTFADDGLEKERLTGRLQNNPWMPPTIARSFAYSVPYTAAAMVGGALQLIQKEYSATSRRPNISWLSLSAGSFKDMVKGNQLITSLFKPQDAHQVRGQTRSAPPPPRKRTLLDAFVSQAAAQTQRLAAGCDVKQATYDDDDARERAVSEGGEVEEGARGQGRGARGEGGAGGGDKGPAGACPTHSGEVAGECESQGGGGGGGGRGRAVYSAGEIDEDVLAEVRGAPICPGDQSHAHRTQSVSSRPRFPVRGLSR